MTPSPHSLYTYLFTWPLPHTLCRHTCSHDPFPTLYVETPVHMTPSPHSCTHTCSHDPFPTLVPVQNQINRATHSYSIYLKYILTLSYRICLSLPSGFILWFYHPKNILVRGTSPGGTSAEGTSPESHREKYVYANISNLYYWLKIGSIMSWITRPNIHTSSIINTHRMGRVHKQRIVHLCKTYYCFWLTRTASTLPELAQEGARQLDVYDQ